MIIAILGATIVWFILASILFFNPIVDKVYSSEEGRAGVRKLPKTPKTVGIILLAVLAQCILWAYVFDYIKPALPTDSVLTQGLIFGLILIATKMIPRDIDRLLLSTYPKKRITIEFIIGSISLLAVGVVFGYLL